MMYDFNTMKRAADSGQKVGNWKGMSVFASTKKDLENKGSGAYYIVYDDDNKIIGRKNGRLYCYGNVTKNGTVNELSTPQTYVRYEAPAAATSATTTSVPSGKKREEKFEYSVTSGDVKLEIDVDATLKRAREMTIDDLLKGFNYGLE